MKREEVVFLGQLVKTLEEAELRLEETYEKKDYKNFDRVKKLIIRVQRKISEVVK